MWTHVRLSLVPQSILVVLLAGGSICAQETGGGSTENFKRPNNPPVYHRPRPAVEAGGGRVKDPPGTKPGGRSPQAKSAVAGTPPAAAQPAASEPGAPPPSNAAPAPKPVLPPRLGELKSGGGIRGTPKPTPEPTTSGPQPTPQPTPSGPPPPAVTVTSEPYEINESVEDAIEAGNKARNEKPPDYEEAERVYKVAAQLAPKDARAFEGLGNIYLDQNRNEEAVAAYRKAIELKSKNPQVFEGLGDAYHRLGRYEESIEASAGSLRIDPKPPGAYWTLTWVSLTVGQGEDAGKFANAFIYRWRPLFAGTPPYYIAFAGYLGYWEAGRKDEADKLLAMAGKSSECQDDNWVCRLLKYLRHDITADQLLKEANDNDKLTEAHAYIGMDLALSGRRAEALPHLRWVVEHGNRRFTEYPVAERRLKNSRQ
jgi:tetratricopeptide (TPR) repeat protein